MTRYDLISPRPRKDGKTFWTKIGAAFPRDKGGFSLTFDALPLPDAEGRVTLLMTEPKERQQQGDHQPRDHAREVREMEQSVMGDEIPF